MGKRLRELARRVIASSNDADNPLAYRERYVLLALANALMDNPGETWTSDAVIAVKVGMSTDAYYRARTALIELGLMTRVKGSGQGSHSNRYRLFPSSELDTEGSSAVLTEVGGNGSDSSSAHTPISTADTATSSADTPVSSASPADISLSNPKVTQMNPSSYDAPAAPTHANNVTELIAKTDLPIPTDGKIDDEYRRAEIQRLNEMEAMHEPWPAMARRMLPEDCDPRFVGQATHETSDP